ncbi:MAG: hypothetical protein AAF517_15560, partial [Planctomycetota bacterium]
TDTGTTREEGSWSFVRRSGSTGVLLLSDGRILQFSITMPDRYMTLGRDVIAPCECLSFDPEPDCSDCVRDDLASIEEPEILRDLSASAWTRANDFVVDGSRSSRRSFQRYPDRYEFALG